MKADFYLLRSHYYQDGRIYDVPEGIEQPESSVDEARVAQPLPLPSQAVLSPSSSCSTVSAAVHQQAEQHETSTAKKKKKVRDIHISLGISTHS